MFSKIKKEMVLSIDRLKTAVEAFIVRKDMVNIKASNVAEKKGGGVCMKCGKHTSKLFDTSLYSPGPQHMCLVCLHSFYNVKKD